MTDQVSEVSRSSHSGAGQQLSVSKLLPLVLVVLTMVALFWPRGSDTAPEGNLLNEMSEEVPLRPGATKVTLVHFWATWCAPCIQEIPALQRLIANYSTTDDLRVAVIAVDDSPEKVKPFLGSLGAPVLYDPSWKMAHQYGTRKLPETHLVVEGQVVETFQGATNWDDPKIRKTIDQLLVNQGAPGG